MLGVCHCLEYVCVCVFEVCKFKAHKRCAVRATNNCKWTTLASIGKDIIEDEDGVSVCVCVSEHLGKNRLLSEVMTLVCLSLRSLCLISGWRETYQSVQSAVCVIKHVAVFSACKTGAAFGVKPW